MAAKKRRAPRPAALQWRSGWLAGAQHLPSPHHNARPAGVAVDTIVIHSISLPPGRHSGHASGREVLRLFAGQLRAAAHPSLAALQGVEVSAHFFIRRNGHLVQCVDADARAWHAGASSLHGRENCNDYSIGIELEGLEGGRFCAAQYRTLAALIRALAARYAIAHIVGHEHIAPGRKADPGPGFDWRRLSRTTRLGARQQTAS